MSVTNKSYFHNKVVFNKTKITKIMENMESAINNLEYIYIIIQMGPKFTV